MKFTLVLSLALFFLFQSPIARGEKEEKAPANPSKKEISTVMSQVWCQKMEECAKDKSMSVKECEKILFKSFKTGLDNVPKDKGLEVTRESVDECKNSITAGTCDALKIAQTLPGCDFISLLNPK